MAIIRGPTDVSSSFNYLSALGLLGCVGTIVLMLKFKGFKASLNFTSRRKQEENDGEPIMLSMTGSYRVNRDEFYGNGRIFDPPKRLSPSMVKLPPSFQPEPSMRPTQSAGDLTRADLPQRLDKSILSISLDPRGGTSSNRNSSNEDQQPKKEPKKENKGKEHKSKTQKEQEKLEKKRLAEQKAKEKADALEQARQEKARKEREKQAARDEAKAKKESKKKKAPPAPQPLTNPLALNQPLAGYSTNTLDSSISRSTGPPPYSEVPQARLGEVELNEASDTSAPDVVNSNPSNVSFGKPIDNTPNSWDMISQHRQQMNRPLSTGLQKARKKNMVMDLQYRLGNNDDNEDNSEA